MFGFDGPTETQIFLSEHRWVLVIGLTMLGAIVGSFIGTVVARWPEGRSIVSAPSACESCGKRLRAGELIPIVSFVIQRGKCRGCGTKIDRWQLAAEIGGAAVGLLAALAWIEIARTGVDPNSTDLQMLYFLLLLGWQLLLIGLMDARHFWLPWQLTALLAATGVLAHVPNVILFQHHMPERLPGFLADWLIGAMACFAALWLIAFTYRKLRGRDGMGGGDPWLLGALALWLGWQGALAVLLLAVMLGIIWAVALKLAGKAIDGATLLPLGSLMALATFLFSALAVGIGVFI